jgi:glyoxylase-like metal-dependent hydrolase (beta-lactamase superfamily II)
MEIFPNVHEIRSTFGNRYILQYLFVGDTVVLLDAGIIGTPQSAIFPYMEKIGISPQRLSMVIAMHADGDHHGGLPAIKDASGSTLLACHQGDRALIQDPEYLYENRYNFLSRDHQLGFGREGLVHSPRACKINVLLSAEETIQIAPGWKLRVWHVPGHSEGHLAIYDERNRAAFTSDAVQASGCPTTSGSMAFSPTYYAVDAYLATIRFLENQPIEHIYSGHWSPVHGIEVKAFLDQSRDFVESADAAIKMYLSDHRGGVTLKQLIYALGPKLGTWPEDTAPFFQFALYGHLLRLQQRRVVRFKSGIPIEYLLA